MNKPKERLKEEILDHLTLDEEKLTDLMAQRIENMKIDLHYKRKKMVKKHLNLEVNRLKRLNCLGPLDLDVDDLKLRFVELEYLKLNLKKKL